ncbi:MAG: hypothetical protein F2836_05770 [Actinobacteria bacterium]|nr:hypothetical protein [Actinomycetota bacterium]
MQWGHGFRPRRIDEELLNDSAVTCQLTPVAAADQSQHVPVHAVGAAFACEPAVESGVAVQSSCCPADSITALIPSSPVVSMVDPVAPTPRAHRLTSRGGCLPDHQPIPYQRDPRRSLHRSHGADAAVSESSV